MYKRRLLNREGERKERRKKKDHRSKKQHFFGKYTAH